MRDKPKVNQNVNLVTYVFYRSSNTMKISLYFLRKSFFNEFQFLFHFMFIEIAVITIVNAVFAELMQKVISSFCFFISGVHHQSHLDRSHIAVFQIQKVNQNFHLTPTSHTVTVFAPFFGGEE